MLNDLYGGFMSVAYPFWTLALDMYVPIVFSGFLAFVLGLVWYHPKVMGGRWAEAAGSYRKVNLSPLTLIVSLFLWILAACFYAFLAQLLGVDKPGGYFCLSCLVWVAFSMPPIFISALYTGYSFEAMAIDTSYQLGGYYIFAAVHIAFLEMEAL